MSEQNGDAGVKQRKARLADLAEQLAEEVASGELSGGDLMAAELLADRIEAECAKIGCPLPGETGAANGEGEIGAAAEVAAPANEGHAELPGEAAVEELITSDPPAKLVPADWRLEMIEQAQREAKAQRDPVRGSLAAFKAGLMRIALRSEVVVEQASAETLDPAAGSELTDPAGFLSTPIERLERMQPMLDSHCRLIKLIMRLSDLEARLARPLPTMPRIMKPEAARQEAVRQEAAIRSAAAELPAATLPPAGGAFQLPQDRLGDRRQDAFMPPGELAEMLRATRGQRVYERNGKQKK